MPPRKAKIKLNCLHCNEIHLKLPCQLGRGRGKFCSKACKVEYSKTKVEVICEGCSTTFKKFPCELRETGNFCDKVCYHKYRRENAKDTTYLKIGAIHEHRVVAETVLKRKLFPGEVVHHIDEDKHNNSPSNLAVLPNQELHAKHHLEPGSVDMSPFLLSNYL